MFGCSHPPLPQSAQSHPIWQATTRTTWHSGSAFVASEHVALRFMSVPSAPLPPRSTLDATGSLLSSSQTPFENTDGMFFNASCMARTTETVVGGDGNMTICGCRAI